MGKIKHEYIIIIQFLVQALIICKQTWMIYSESHIPGWYIQEYFGKNAREFCLSLFHALGTCSVSMGKLSYKAVRIIRVLGVTSTQQNRYT